MKKYDMLLTGLMLSIVLLYLFSLMGCGVAVTSTTAQSAVENAKSAVVSARESDAEVYSKDNLKNAERLLKEAESSLSRNRWQRAYTLAKKAGKSAEEAEQEAMKQTGEKTFVPITAESLAMPNTTVVTKSPELTTPATKQAIDIPTKLSPQPMLAPMQPTQLSPPMAKELPVAELQNRVQAAFLSLQSAQNSIQTARLLMIKIQVDLGLLMMDNNIQIIQNAGGTQETISLIKSMYSQAQQSSIMGNYDNALRILDQINAYMRALFTSAQ